MPPLKWMNYSCIFQDEYISKHNTEQKPIIEHLQYESIHVKFQNLMCKTSEYTSLMDTHIVLLLKHAWE